RVHGGPGRRSNHGRSGTARQLRGRDCSDEAGHSDRVSTRAVKRTRANATQHSISLTVNSKILGRDQLRQRVEEWRRAGDSIILANGGFDLLHVGHVRYLRGAKELGGRLIVAINSDESVRALKGEGRPIMPVDERAEMVAALEDVDAVVIFPEIDVRTIIREIRPDIQAKGTDYTAESVPERD